jgi:carbon-monoxide dehydrogenase iron sulfur subunit
MGLPIPGPLDTNAKGVFLMTHSIRIRVNSKKCRDCHACMVGCSVFHENECNEDLSRVRIEKDMERFVFDIKICKQCKNPKCMAACPEGAIYKDDRGIVHIIDEKCTRCGACLEACPFDALFFSKAANRYIKCDLCESRSEGPLCAQLCPVGALTVVTVKNAEE